MNPNLIQRNFVAAAVLAAWLAAAVSAAAQSTNGTDFASFQLIGQRNIFDPNRVPHRPFAARAAAPVADSFSFVGTMSYAKGAFAFFDGTSPDFRKVLELGGDVAGFKLTALAAKSATLVSGTNQFVLQMGTQVRRDDDGNWTVVTNELATYGSTGSSYASTSGRRYFNRRRYDGSARNYSTAIATTAAGNSQPDDTAQADSGTDTNAPDASVPPEGGANDPLSRLMRQRALEQQQLGQGQ